MIKNIFSTLLYVLILFPFIWVAFFDDSILYSSFIFLGYAWLIQAFHSNSHHRIGWKDFLFTIIFCWMVTWVYHVFLIKFNFNQISLLFLSSFIGVVSVLNNHDPS